MSEHASYLYAVTPQLRGQAVDGVAGIGGAPVRIVAAGELSCVISDVELGEFGEQALRQNLEQLDWLARVAREHNAVIDAICRITTALPVRLATIYRDDASATAQVMRRLEAARGALARVAGREEWGVKVFGPIAEESTAETSRAASGTEYLRRRRAALQQQTSAHAAAQADADAVFEQLAELAIDARRHRPQDPQLSGNRHPMLLNAAFLVEREEVPDFQKLVAKLAAGHPSYELALTGPWPPYSFAAWDDS